VQAPLPAAEQAVRGRVVDLASAPLAGLTVVLRDNAGSEGAPAAESARTGSDGSFRLATEDGRGYLRVDDARWTTVLAGATVRESTGQEAIVVAAPRLSLLGVVLDAAGGQPVAGAHVRVELPPDFRADFALDLDHSVDVAFSAATDAAGEFLLADAPLCAEARLVCAAEGFLSHEEPLPLADGSRRVIALERAPAEGVLRGRVVDLAGQPVEDARVSLGLDVVKSDAQGDFAFDLRAPEGFTAQFNVQAAHFGVPAVVPDTLLALAPGALPGRFTAPRSPVGEPVWPAYVTLRLGEEPLAIAGTVFGAGGEPAAGARVWLADPTFFGGLGDPSSGDGPALVHVETLLAGAEGAWRPVTADDRGRFRIEGLMDREYTVAAMDEETLLRAVVPGVPAGRDHLVIELPVAEVYPVLAGTVVGHDGEPLAGVSVFPMCDAFELKVAGNVIGTHHAAAESVVTDEEGRFRLVNVPRNLVYLRLEGPDVLPLEWGRHVEGGLFELVGDRASALEIAVDRRCHFQIELSDPAEADEFELLDAAGHKLEISEFAGHNRRESDRQPLVEGRTNPMAAPDSTATVVLYLAGEEVRRAPAHLVFGERVTLRP
jgi:protocatechuate 3,4-dioxygenase beta subunit